MDIEGQPINPGFSPTLRPIEPPREVPWQIWITVVLLGLEGVGNLFALLHEPAALIWIVAKVLFIVGLIRGWAWVFALFQVITGYHVLAFSHQVPFIAFLNLVLMLLVGSASRYYFPGNPRHQPLAGANPPSSKVIDREFDL